MNLEDQILFTAEWGVAITFGITIILLLHSLLFN